MRSRVGISKVSSILFLLLFVTPFFVLPGASSVWDSNEAFYVQTPREMLERPSLLIPYFNGEPRLNKPPLSYWIVGVLYALLGVDLLWERLAMAVFSAGSVLLVYLIGRASWDPRSALWAAGIFATTFRFLVLSRRLFIDILLLFFLLAAIACFLRWSKTLKPGYFLLSSVCLALGCLAKGPVSLLPAILVFVFILFEGRQRSLFNAPLLPAGSLFLLISVPWYALLGVEAGWENVTNFLLKENLGRFTHLDYGPERGYFYYLGVFLADFFPWSIFALAGVVWWVRRGRKHSNESERQNVRLLLIWILVWILIFSLSRNKQEYYILPVYPAAAVLAAGYLRRARVASWLAVPTMVLLLGAASGLYLAARVLFPDQAFLWVPPAMLLPLPWLSYRRRWLEAILATSLFYAAVFGLYLEPLERYRPIRTFAEQIRELEKNRHEFYVAGYFRLASPSLAFYLNEPILELSDFEQATRHLDSNHRVYLVLDGSEFDALQAGTRARLQILDARPRLSTKASAIVPHLLSGDLSPREWTRPVYLITNQASGGTDPVSPPTGDH